VATYLQARNQKPKAKNQKSGIGVLPRGDYPLIAAIGALAVLGLLMVYSGSYDLAYQNQGGDAAYYLIRQVLFLAGGTLVAFLIARSDYAIWRRWSVLLMFGTLGLLFLVLVAGSERLGAQRTLFNGSIQPSEIAKLMMVLYIADWLASKGDKLQLASYGLIPFSAIVGVVAGLIFRQPDYGTGVLIVLTAGAMFFIAGADLKQAFIGMVVAATTILILMLMTSHTSDRIGQFIDPARTSDQMKQVILALKSGGLTGVGLGNGILKIGYLPLAHTDSIFALVAAELGLVGVIGLLSLYAFVAYRGYRIAVNAPDTYGQLLAFGATTSIIVQALINICVMTGTLPLTGITLPFMSYGGSSLISLMASIGVLISVSRGTRKGKANDAFMDRGRRDRRSRLPGSGSR
jgi:cell division protein FtsW